MAMTSMTRSGAFACASGFNPAPGLWAGVALLLLGSLAGADWRQFRGTHSTGVADDAVPEQVEQSVAWKVDLPDRGVSGPIVVGDRLFLTASGGAHQDQLHVLAFDTRSGRKLWQRSFWATGPTSSHPKTCMAAPTPASDGERLIAFFATNDLFCLDFDGRVRWVRSLYDENDGATDGRGLASSPVIAGSTVIVQVDNQNTPFAVGVDIATGRNRWRIERPREIAWTSPILLPATGNLGELVLLQGSTRLSAHDPTNGREVWHIDRALHPIASTVRDGNVLYVPGENALLAFELQPEGKPPKLLWDKPKLNNAGFSSPLVLNGRVYVLKNSILLTGDARTGEVLGQLRLKGSYSSSPVAAGGLIYCFSDDSDKAVAQVVRPDAKEGKIVASWSLKEAILCTPAIAGGALYVRSDHHLWKIAKS
jgi:outer membrane protein assembly factor BamB